MMVLEVIVILINEVSKLTNLTKKAIEYYTEQKLISPAVLENGYRDFSQSDVECLKKVSVFRKLGLSTQDIKTVLADETGAVLQKISFQKELDIQRERAKKVILDKLCCGEDYSEIGAELKAIERSLAVTEKLLEAFPGYYGRFLCLHFARFLNEPMKTEEQHRAYGEIIAFLDNAPPLSFPEDLQTFFDENTRHYSTEIMSSMIEDTKQAIENPERFLSENKEYLKGYLEFRQSDEYKNSPVGKIQTLLKEFQSASGYYDSFLPAMKKLSTSYAEYSRKVEAANEKLLSQYPEINNITQ